MSLPTPEEFDDLSMKEKLDAIVNAMSLFQLLSKIKDIISEDSEENNTYQLNFDNNLQEVGDIVKLTSVLGTGYLWDEKHLKNRTPSKLERLALLHKTAIVVEINCKKELKCNHCEHLHDVETLIYFPDTKEKFYTMNKFLTSI